MQNVNDNGVMYIAFGRPYLAMAAISAASAKYYSPGMEVAVVTNVAEEPIDHSLPFDHWIYIDDLTENNRSYKNQAVKYTPFERTVFIDCDTVAVGDISVMYSWLDYFDIAMQAKGLLPGYKHAHLPVLDKWTIGELTVWGSGTIGFKTTPEVHQLFDYWAEAFDRFRVSSDQPAFVEAVFRSSARPLTLDSRWGCPVETRLRDRDSLSGEKHRIVHYSQSVITPDIERYLIEVDTLLVKYVNLPESMEVQQFITKKHNRRKKMGKRLIKENLLPFNLPDFIGAGVNSSQMGS